MSSRMTLIRIRRFVSILDNYIPKVRAGDGGGSERQRGERKRLSERKGGAKRPRERERDRDKQREGEEEGEAEAEGEGGRGERGWEGREWLRWQHCHSSTMLSTVRKRPAGAHGSNSNDSKCQKAASSRFLIVGANEN